MTRCGYPSSWKIEEGSESCIVPHATGQPLAYVCFENEASLMSIDRDDAW